VTIDEFVHKKTDNIHKLQYLIASPVIEALNRRINTPYTVIGFEIFSTGVQAQIRAGMVADNPQIRRAIETASGLRDGVFHRSFSTGESSSK
jgi:hypothetical protein